MLAPGSRPSHTSAAALAVPSALAVPQATSSTCTLCSYASYVGVSRNPELGRELGLLHSEGLETKTLPS